MKYKNIVFDLGGVVVARDPSKCTQEFINFFNYLRDPMPQFWHEYDRGALSFDETKEALRLHNGVSRELCDEYIARSIVMQEEMPATKRLIEELKASGECKLFVLSNMAPEYIKHIRARDVYRHFDGEVISCEEGVIKPERRIYEILVERYGLNPEETLFIDDRLQNLEAAEQLGVVGFHFNPMDAEGSCQSLRDLLL
ncbi:MAG: HAD family phosphatase [Rikenellaceae bacterium]